MNTLTRRQMLEAAVSTLVASRAARSQPLSSPGELWTMSASTLARAIAEKRATSREVVESHLSRIDAVNGELNAVTAVLRDEALAAADDADRSVAAGKAVGPLHGVPITVKENIDVKGSATTQGARVLAAAVAPSDAPSIVRLRRAGAIPMARTNLPDFGLRWHTDSGLRGATLNPWDPDRTPGGSSGGDAAAIASGMTPLGIGNDYGGSLRWPAQCCGIASLKTSRGRVASASSTAPGDPPLTLQMFAVDGPMARSVADLRLALAAMSGPDPRDPWSVPAPLEGAPVPRPIRVALTADPGGGGTGPHVADGVRKAARALEQAGYAVEEVEPPAVEEAAALWNELVTTELRMLVWPSIREIASAGATRFIEPFLEQAPPSTFERYMLGFGERNRIAREWSLFFERYPLVLGPVSTEPPFVVGLDLEGAEASARIFRSMRLVVLANLLGLPAAAVPVGVVDGIPQGVQILGSMYREDLCLDAAQAIESRLGTFTPMDPRRKDG